MKKKKKKELTPLETKKGSKIFYSSKYNVGKEIGGKLYAHMNYINDVVPEEVIKKAMELFKEHVDVKCNTFCWGKKKPHLIRFDESPNFDSEREPSPGRIWHIDTETGEVTAGATNQIFHHKWLWVKTDYLGFNVDESYEWSKLWLSKFEEPASGYLNKWKEQLEAVGLE
jgi:hypothetical protein